MIPHNMPQGLKRFLFPFSKREPTESDRYASYYERVFATCIDMGCLFFVLFEPFAWLSRIVYGKKAPDLALEQGANLSWQQAIDIYVRSDLFSLVLLNIVFQLVIIGIVLITCQRAFGTTPGRYLIGIKLVSAKTETEPSLFQLIIRYLGYFISLPPLMLGYIWCLWDKKRQTWHDKIAGTVMLDLRPHGWYWQQVKRGYALLRGKTAAQNTPKDTTSE